MQWDHKVSVPGSHFTQEDWQVRVFGSPGPIDRPSDRLSIRTAASVWVHG